ncbi:hypothetical protein HMPREF1635_03710 [Clostridiales bacterium S5-A14a]|nr:hypothetical protein HMPREF1635_03710 [Clostridiales bacterium S5-A14a]
MKTHYLKSKIFALATMVFMILALVPMNAMADDTSSNNAPSEKYIMMNVPYSDFYGQKIDSVTSATKKKTMNEKIVGGSYHTPDGSQILGVTCPVKVGEGVDLSNYKKVDSEADLFAGDNYSYVEISETPKFYLEATNADGAIKFSIPEAVKKSAKQVNPEVGEIAITDDRHVDYAIKLKNYETFLHENTKVYGVTIEGGGYSSKQIRHLAQIRNIYKKYQIGASKEEMGKFIGGVVTKITYYTSDGIYEISNIRISIPKLIDNKAGEALKVDNVPYGTGSTPVTVNLPDRYIGEYFLDGNKVNIDNGRIVTSDLSVGVHKLTAKDRFKEYANVDAYFTVTTDKMPAKYDGKKSIVKEENFTDEDFAGYLNNVTKMQIKVGDKTETYKVSGKHSIPIIDKKTGSLDFESDKVAKVKTDFPDLSDAEITVLSDGYKDLKFNLKTETPKENNNTQEPGENNESGDKPTTGDKPSDEGKPDPSGKPHAGSNPEIRELNVITEGQNDDKTIAKDNAVIYVIGESTKATFRILGDELKVEDLKGVLVDGQLINKTNYDVRQGSIIVTFKKSYVDSLKPGKHDITFDTKKGTAKAELVVKDKAQLNVTTNSNSENTPANTGDTSGFAIYTLITLAAIGGLYKTLRKN